VLSATFTQAWVSPYPLSLNAPGWSLSVEMFFYATFPMIVHFVRKHETHTVNLAVFSLAVYLVTQLILSSLMNQAIHEPDTSLLYDLVFYFPIFHYCSFLLGITGGVFFLRNPGHFNSIGPAQFWIFLLAVFSSYFFLQNPDFLRKLVGYPLAYDTSFYGPLFLALILGTASSKNLLTRVLTLPVLVFLGETSYSFYILQQPVYTLYTEHLSNRLDFDVNLDFFTFLAILVAVASVTYLLFEKACKTGILGIYSRLSPYAADKSTQSQKDT
jgi:peptidoglycan/LPS O-acetylase OafA/YrhL